MRSSWVIAALALIGGAACGRLGYDSVAPQNWLDPDSSAFLRITIPPNRVAEDLSGFPLLVKIDAAELPGARADGSDIRFFSASDNLELPHDLGSAPGSGEMVAWVSVPTVYRDSETMLDLYFGNSQAKSTANPAAVWKEHDGVWHFDEDPKFPIEDATGNQNAGTSVGGMNENALVPGVAASAYDFDGLDDGLKIPSQTISDAIEPITITWWARSRLFTKNGAPLITRAEGVGTALNDFIIRAWESCLGGSLYNGTSFPLNCIDWSDTTDWHHMAVTIADGQLQLYFDGKVGSEVAYTGSVAQSGYPLRVGTFGVADDTRTWNGEIDEVWFATQQRSPAWISALHANQSGQAFYEISTVETR